MQLQIDRRPDGRVIIEIPGNGHDTPCVETVHASALPPIGGLHQGGLYAGLTVADNDPTELILLPGEFEGNWKDAAWLLFVCVMLALFTIAMACILLRLVFNAPMIAWRAGNNQAPRP
jgi:hypothetical protein